jgi:hypothetical protein
MIRKVKLFVLTIIMTIIIFYFDFKISTYDMRFYAGKDNGLSIVFESIVIFSTIFFLIMSEQNRILNIIIGFFIGIFTGILNYIIITVCIGRYLNNTILVYHIISFLLCIKLFFVIEKLLAKIKVEIKNI